MDHSDYRWHLAARFEPDASYETVRQFLGDLDAALVLAAEQTMCRNGEAGITLELNCGMDDAIERRITLRRAFQIAEVPATVDRTTYSSAGEAIEHLRAIRALARTDVARRLTVVREPDGSFRIGQHAPDACDFSSQVAAEEALANFEDPTRYAVMPYVEITTERNPEEDGG